MFRRYITIALTALAVPATAETFTLGLSSLPSAQGFAYISGGPNNRGESAYFFASGFAIDQDTRGDPVNFGGGAYYSRGVTLGANGDFTVEADAIVRQYEGTNLGGGTIYPFGFIFGLENTFVGIAGERFGTYSAGEGVRYYDIPAGFSINDRHAYTLRSQSGAVTFSADGQTLFSTALTGSQTGFDQLVFGDGTGYANAAGRYFGLIYNSGAVPEPATWALMILGFAAVGLQARRAALSA